MRWLKPIVWILCGVLALAAVSVAAGLVYLQTASGKAWLAASLDRTFAGKARIAGIGGAVPFHLKLARLSLLDWEGEWATLRDVRLDIAPWDLLRRRLTIREFSARTVEVARARRSSAEGSTTTLGIPHLPVAVELKRLDAGSIALAPALLGERVELTLHGAARLARGDVALSLSLARTDGQRGDLEAHVELKEDLAWLKADFRAEEPSGMLLQRILARPDRLPLKLRLQGEGPLADWQGRLAATAGDRAQLEARLAIRERADGIRVATRGELEVASLLPAAMAPLVEPRLAFSLAVLDRSDGSVVAGELTLDTDSIHLSGSGAYRDETRGIGLSLRLTAPDLEKFAALLGTPLSGMAEATVSASGPRDRPVLAVTAHGQGLARGADRIERATAELTLTPDGPLGARALHYTVLADGRIEGIASGAQPILADFRDLVIWRLAANLDPEKQAVTIRNFSLSDAGVTLTGNAAVDRLRREANGRFHLVIADLARFSALAGTDLAGHGAFDATLGSDDSGTARLNLEGALDDLATSDPIGDAVLGHRLRLRLAAARQSSGSLTLDTAAIDAKRLHLRAHGNIDAQTRALAGRFTLALEAPPEGGQAYPLSGKLRLDGTVGGDLSSPRLETRLDGRDLVWQQRRLDHVSAHAQAKLGTSPSVELEAAFRAHAVTGRLAAEAALDSARRTLVIPRLRLAAAGTILEGTLRTALDTRLTSGSITVRVPDLAPWSQLAGEPLSGRIGLRLVLTSDRGQGATLSLSGDKFRMGPAGPAGLVLDRIAANGQLADALRRPSGRLEIDFAGAKGGAARIDRFHLGAESASPERASFELRLAGDFRGPLELASAGEVAYPGGGVELELERLEGRLVDYPIRLERPLRVAERNHDVTLSNLALALGAGSLTGAARLQPDRISTTLAAKALPIGLAGKLVGRGDIDGALDLDGDLGGTVAQPHGRVALQVRDLRLKGLAHAGTPSLGIGLEATIDPQHVGFHGSLAGPGGQSIGFEGAVPVRFQRQPLSIALARDRPLSLRMHGDVQLERIADLLPLAGDRIAGNLHLDLDVGGTLAVLATSGSLALAQGHYENLASGLVLDGAAMELVGERDRIVLRRLGATDGGKGRLEGSGSVALAGSPGASLDLDARFYEFQIVHRDDALARMSGQARVEGAPSQPHLVAKLNIDEAELYIPDRLPPSAQALPVTVIDSATGQVLQTPGEERSASAAGVTLDVQVAIPGRAFVRGHGLNSEWKGNLHISGTSAAPQVIGSLEVVHGSFALFGKDLSLSRGTIAFTGGHKIDPTLDVLAQAAASDITAQVEATGTASDPKIKLSSIPELPQDEVLSRLLFGHGLGRVTPAQGLQLAQAAQTLANGGPGMLDRVRSKLGLDLLDIVSAGGNTGTAAAGIPSTPGARTASSSGGAGGAPSVSAGKYVANGVYVGAEQGVSGQSRSTVEVEVAPNVTLDSKVSPQGGNDIGLNWKLDY